MSGQKGAARSFPRAASLCFPWRVRDLFRDCEHEARGFFRLPSRLRGVAFKRGLRFPLGKIGAKNLVALISSGARLFVAVAIAKRGGDGAAQVTQCGPEIGLCLA